jgi:hypothetical protein
MTSAFATRAFYLLIRRWMWLAMAAIVAASAVVIANSYQPPEFVATVNLVPQRARTEVNYDERVRTLSSDVTQLGQGSQQLPSATAERRQALAQLVVSAEIEQAVRESLGDSLPADLRAPGKLLTMVEGRSLPRSEMITVEAHSPSAATAEMIADAWAKAYAQRVNELFGAPVSSGLKLDREVEEARQKYQAAETSLTTFLGSTPLGENSRQLEAKQRVLTELIAVQQAQVVDLYKIELRVGQLASQAEALQQLLAEAQDNSTAASSATALTLLKTQAFASSMVLPAALQLQLEPASSGSQTSTQPSATTGTAPTGDPGVDVAATSRALQDWGLPANLQLQVSPPTSAATLVQQRADVAATVRSLRDWQTRLHEEIRVRSAAGASTTSSADLTQTITALEADVRALHAQVAEQSARQRNLLVERDTVWDSYVSVSKKFEEARVSGLIGSGNEVSIGGRSGSTVKPRNTAAGAALAALLGAALVGLWIVLTEPVSALYRRAAAEGAEANLVAPGAPPPGAGEAAAG